MVLGDGGGQEECLWNGLSKSPIAVGLTKKGRKGFGDSKY